MPLSSPIWRRRRRGGGFNPASVGNLQQYLLSTTAISGSTIFDESPSGDARPIQLGRCYDFDGTNDYVAITGMGATNNYFGACTISVYVNIPVAVATNVIWSLGTSAYRLMNIAGIWNLNTSVSTGVAVTTGWQKVSVTYNAAGQAISFRINDVQLWTGIVAAGIGATTTFYLGARHSGGVGLFFTGSMFDFSITGSSVKNLALRLDEQSGTTAYDSSGNGNHGTLVNGVAHSTQDVYSWQNEVGYSQRMYFDGVNDGVDLPSALIPTTGDFELSYKTVTPIGFIPSSNLYAISQYTVGVAGRFLVGINTSGQATLNIQSSSLVGSLINDGLVHTIKVTRVGNVYTLFIDDVSQGTFTRAGAIETKNTEIGKTDSIPRFYQGLIWDVNINNAHHYQGYGNTNADWVDTIGSANGLVVGTPANKFISRNEAIPTQDVLGNPLQFTGRVPYNALLKQSNCVQFNGTSQYVSIPYNVLQNRASGQELVVGISFLTTSVASRMLIDNRIVVAPHVSGFFLGLSDAGLVRVKVYKNDGSTGDDIISTNAYNTGLPYHVELIINDSNHTVRIYSDSVLLEEITVANTGSVDNSPNPVLLGATSIVSSYGFWNNKLWNFYWRINGTVIMQHPIASGAGVILFDKSPNNINGTLINSPTWAKQDAYHGNIEHGFNKYTNFDGVDDSVTLPTTIRTDLSGKGKVEFRAKVFIPNFPAVVTNAVFSTPVSATLTGFAFGVTASGQLRVSGRRISTDSFLSFTTPITLGYHEIRGYFDYQNQEYGFKIDDNDYVTGATAFASGAGNYTVGTPSSNATIGNTDTVANTFWSGVLFDCELWLDDVLTNRWNGYDNTVGAWADIVGTRNATALAGSPALLRVPAETSTTDVFDQPLRNPAGIWHNGAETLIDFTGGVASPAAVQGAWEDDWDFNTARTNPKFKRTRTYETVEVAADRFLAYEEVLSGEDLTKVETFTATKEI